MESLKVNTGHAKEKLIELQSLIRQQRIALLNGESAQTLITVSYTHLTLPTKRIV